MEGMSAFSRKGALQVLDSAYMLLWECWVCQLRAEKLDPGGVAGARVSVFRLSAWEGKKDRRS